MTLTTCQQIILHCLFVASEDPRGFKKYRDSWKAKYDPETRVRANEKARRFRENHPERGREAAARCRKGNPNYLKEVSAQRENLRRKLDLLKMERPCYDCGGDFPPRCMEWDHLPQFEKSFNIGTKLHSRSLDAIMDEISKCQLVCANCHRIRTINRAHEKGKRA